MATDRRRRMAGGGQRQGEDPNQNTAPNPPSQGFDSIDDFVQAFPEQFADMEPQAQQRAMDAYNGALFEGATKSDAIRMAVGAAKSFAGGRATGQSPSVQT